MAAVDVRRNNVSLPFPPLLIHSSFYISVCIARAPEGQSMSRSHTHTQTQHDANSQRLISSNIKGKHKKNNSQLHNTMRLSSASICNVVGRKALTFKKNRKHYTTYVYMWFIELLMREQQTVPTASKALYLFHYLLISQIAPERCPYPKELHMHPVLHTQVICSWACAWAVNQNAAVCVWSQITIDCQFLVYK